MGFLNRPDAPGKPPRRTGDKFTDRALQEMIDELGAAAAQGRNSVLLTIKVGPRGLSAQSSIPIYAKHLEAEGHVITSVNSTDWGPANLTVTPRGAAAQAAPPAPAADDVSNQLARLAELHASGALSVEEFAQAKSRLLS